MSKWLDKVIEIAEELGWEVNDGYFSKYSPAGQDFGIEININEDFDAFLRDLRYTIDAYDVSEETYLWLDSDGHGKNGAPYDMKDVYEDMEACLDNMIELRDELEELEFDEEEEE